MQNPVGGLSKIVCRLRHNSCRASCNVLPGRDAEIMHREKLRYRNRGFARQRSASDRLRRCSIPTSCTGISHPSPIGGRHIVRSRTSLSRCRERRGWRSSAAAMPGCRRRWNWPSTASTRSCSKPSELGFGASTRNGGAVSGGVNIGKSFTGRAVDIERRAGAEYSVRRRRRLRPDRPPDRRRADRLLLGKARPFCRRLDHAGTFAAQTAAAGPAQRGGAVGRLHGAARTPARRDRQRLLLRRHGRRALGQIASGALLQGAARCLPPARRRGLRQGRGRPHRPGR